MIKCNLTFGQNSIKSDFIAIQNKYIGSYYYPNSRDYKEQVYQDFYNWMEKYELDIEFKLIFGEQSISFEPIGNVNQYAIKGILDL